MIMFSAGDIAWAQTPGTELESFSQKSQRYVLVAFSLEDDVFVYPLSSRKPAKGPAWRAGEQGYIVLDRGLYRVPARALTPHTDRAHLTPALRDRIRQDLHSREIRNLNESGKLTQRALQQLQHLKVEGQSEPERQKPKPKPISDQELFDQYLDRDFGKKT